MAEQSSSGDQGYGRISSGLANNTLIERTLDFVHNELPMWRDDPTRAVEEAEERLNAQLCKFLNVASRHRFPMIHFAHEEKQTADRRVDIAAAPNEGQFIGETYHTIYNPFVVFEGKRLPSPTRDREQEYVTGEAKSSGGIQRFKLGLHGAKHKIAAIIGYIQNGSPSEWLERINRWIFALDGRACATGETWKADEQIVELVYDSSKGVSQGSSRHKRIGSVVSDEVAIRHLWIQMNFRS